MAYVTIDGSYLLANERPRNRFGQATLDLGAPQSGDAKRFLVASGLPDGRHEFELTVSGDVGTGSSAPGVAFDGVVVSRDRTFAAETVYVLGLIASGIGGLWLLRGSVGRAIVDGIDYFRADPEVPGALLGLGQDLPLDRVRSRRAFSPADDGSHTSSGEVSTPTKVFEGVAEGGSELPKVSLSAGFNGTGFLMPFLPSRQSCLWHQ